mgnify:FL=1
MTIINANIAFDEQERADMAELVDINTQLKALEARKKTISEKVKSAMVNKKIDKVDINGSKLSIIQSTRKMVSKKTKDEFIAQLVGLGKKHLIKTSIEPDIESIFAEVDAGTLDSNMVNSYVKVTPVTTLRCDV